MNSKLHDERFGYYTVDNQQYDNKWDAMIHATSLNTTYTWDLAPEIFSRINWSEPITTSLDELYRMRLQQLREKYDYLILFFSGGKDSLNILMTSINNNIFIDEIVVYYPFAMEKYFNNKEIDSDNLYSEIEYAAKPILKMLENRIDKRTKIRFQDIGETTAKFHDKADWFDEIKPANTLQMVSPSYGGACDIDLIKLAFQCKMVGVITGADKPTIREINGGFYFVFVDASFNVIPRPSSKEMKNQYDFIHYEAFYQTPEFPQLVVKQAQVVAAAYDTDYNLRNINYQPSDPNSNVYVSERERLIATYIYSDGITPWQTMKHKKNLQRRGEKVVFQTLTNTQKDNYINGVKSIVNKINSRFFIANDYVMGPIPMISKPYFIKTATYKEVK